MLSKSTSTVRNQSADRTVSSRQTDWQSQTLATGVALLMIWLIGQVLLIRPDVPQRVDGVRTRLSFITQSPRMLTATRPLWAVPAPTAMALPPAAALAPRPTTLAPRPIDIEIAEPLAGRLYKRDGRANLPATAQIDPLGTGAVGSPPGLPSARDQAQAKRLLERTNPIDYRATRFDKAWATDGTLGDAMVESMDEGLKGMAKALAGKQDQPARARPPPEVRFNPRLHERPSDLGSEATGDAYKAAPIAFEKAPGLNGEASKRLRGELASLKQKFAHCSAQRWQQVIGPITTHLADLERVEYAYGHGADPVQAEHLLPRTADMAFDQARRALWYAQQRLATCPG